MSKRINAKKVKNEVGIKEIHPLFAKTVITPMWDGSTYKIIVSMNLLGKIVSTFIFPVDIILHGIGDAWDDVVNAWTKEFSISYHIETDDKRFEAAKKLYEEA